MQKEHKQNKPQAFGLKSARAGKRNNTTATPLYTCKNCGCNRYNPCTCQKASS
jgi:hypothetical protein